MIEVERRFLLSQQEFESIEAMFDWGPARRVVDLTLGFSGPTSLQTHGWIVRLRRADAGIRLEFKAPRSTDLSSWVEYGTEVSNFPEAARILTAIGLEPGLLLDRVRRSAVDSPVTYSLDDVRGLGLFLEIEVEAEAGREAEADRAIAAARRRLPLAARASARPYGELMLHRLEAEPEVRAEHERAIKELLELG